MFLLLTSFVSGVLTVLTPCVLPILPIILGASISNTDLLYEKKKKFIIIGALIFSIIIFTLALKFSLVFLNVSENFWRNISGSIIIFVGLTYIFPNLWNKIFLRNWFQRTGNEIINYKTKSNNDFWKNMLTGFALGPIFTSCSPTYFLIIATVLPLSFSLGVIYLLAYACGLGFSLLLISFLGEKLLTNLNFINTKMFKYIIGFIFVAVGILVFIGHDKIIQEKIGQPEVVKQVEEKFLGSEQVGMEKENLLSKNNNSNLSLTENKIGKEISKEIMMPETKKVVFENLGIAKDLTGIVGYINVNEGTTLKEILNRNKVVMLEFWTYSCINCKRTLPYVNDWYAKYHDKGFEIVSVHTPEFAFEKKKENVVENAKLLGVKFPIFMDNDYATWNAYDNIYWPMRILILPNADGTGQIIYKHAGEGDYANNEEIIKQIVNSK